MHRIITLFAVITFPIVYAQKTELTGKITDAKTGEALIGATLMIDGKPVTSTDADGAYSIETEPGEHTFTASYIGYDNQKSTFTLAPGEKKVWNVKLMPSAKELNLMVVTGSRYEKNVIEETVTIDVVSSQLIQNTNAVEAGEVVQKTPGVTVTDGQVSIRGGSGFSYGVGSRVNVMIDGMPILAADQANADWQFIPIEITDQIEVIKGAASVLYGSGSLNGIINVITTWPGEKPATTISPYTLIYGDPNRQVQEWYPEWEQPFATGMFVSHSRKIKEHFDLVLGGNYHFERSYLQNNDEFRGRVNFKTRYRSPKKEGLSFGVNGSFMLENSGRFFLWKDSEDNAYRSFSGSNDKYYYFNIDPFVRYFDKKGNRHIFNSRAYRKFRWGTGSDINTVANIAYADYQFQRRFFKDMFTVTVGTTGSYGWVQSSIFVDSIQLDTTGNPKMYFQTYSAAAFAQLEFSWKWLNLMAGVRYEINGADSLVEGSIPVFRTGANIKAAKATFLRLSFGQSYRIPSLAERFVEAETGGIKIFPNFGLLPEKGWSAEIAVKQGFRITRNWAGFTDFALFWMEYDNMIQYNIGIYPPPNTPPSAQYLGFKPFNIERARIAGFEVSLMGQGKVGPVEILPFMGYTYTYPGDLAKSPSQENVGNYLNNMFGIYGENVITTPKDTLILPFRNRHMVRIDLQLNWKELGLGVNMMYNTFMEKVDQNFTFLNIVIPNFYTGYINNRLHRDGDFVIDIRASYRIKKWNSKVSFIIKNLGNLEYAIRPGMMNAPRNFTLRWDFNF